MSQPGQNPNQNNYPQQPPYNQAPPPGYPPQQPGGYPPQQPGGYPPQQYQGAPYAVAPVKLPANPLLYIIPLVGVVIMAVGVFLPWFNMTLLGGTIGVNGLGTLSGPTDLVNALNQSAGSPGAKDGVLVLGLAGILIVLCLLGLVLKMRGFAIAAIVFGVFSLGLTAFEVSDVSKSINDINATGLGQISAQTGLGIYVCLIGAIVILIGAIVTVLFFRRSKAA